MSTAVADRIAQLTARAAQRGHSPARIARVKSIRTLSGQTRTNLSDQQKRRPDKLRTNSRGIHQPLPCAHMRQWTGGDSYEDRQKDKRERCETMVASYLIAKALGPEWRKEVNVGEGQHISCHIVHASGLKLWLSRAYNQRDRYTIHASPHKAGSITVSARRTPASIAADIVNRLATPSAFEHHKEEQDAKKQRRAEFVKHRQLAMGMVRAAGHRNVKRQKTGHSNNEELNTLKVPMAQIDARIDYAGRSCLSFETCKPEFAEYMIRAAREYAENYREEYEEQQAEAKRIMAEFDERRAERRATIAARRSTK